MRANLMRVFGRLRGGVVRVVRVVSCGELG